MPAAAPNSSAGVRLRARLRARLISLAAVAAALLAAPASALAWGAEGHAVVMDIALTYLTPTARAALLQLLAADRANTLTEHDPEAEASWADAWRGAGHKETAEWHYVDLELDHPDLKAACAGFPDQGPTASEGPAHDCVVDKINAFTAELASPATPQAERVLALKYVIHFVADLEQPLHASDNHDHGGNCVRVLLDGSRTLNLHSYWDTAVVEALSPDTGALARRLRAQIMPQDKAAWEQGGPQDWALQNFKISSQAVYALGSKPGCDPESAPIPLSPAYRAQAEAHAAAQLQKGGVRLALILNRTLGR